MKVRDSVAQPFIASAVGQLIVQGNQEIDIFALNHPHSGLFAGGDLTLKSPNPVIGDAHYWSRGNFQIEDLEGNLGDLNSIEDPIIRAAGNVSFNIYQGTSLHIIAGGSVNAGTITITDVETGTSGIDFIQEAITLTDGTVINIDGSQQATVDIRAGVKPEAIGITGITGFAGFPIDLFADASGSSLEPPPSTSEPTTSTDITIGDIAIIPENGTVLLTNQYEPNLSLSGGDINILSSQGFFGLGIFPLIGNNPMAEIDLVAIDARANVNINGLILASSLSKQGGDVIINSQEDISLTNGEINVTGNEGGSINANAKNININNAQALAGIGEGLGFKNAQAGDIKLDVTEKLEIENSLVFNDVNFDAVGNSGRILVNAQDVVINDSFITTDIAGRGNSGGILIDTSTLSLTNGGLIGARTFGEGDAGLVQVTASEGIALDGERSDGFPSGIFSTVEPDAVGTSGGIVIDTPSLSLTNGGQISASTFGEGDAGLLQISATEGITLDGETSDGLPSGIFSTVATDAVGRSGGILIDTSTLSLTNGGEISARTEGQGDAGLVQITATEGITLDGEKDSDGFASRILSPVARDAAGTSGGIVIDTTSLTLTNGGLISAITDGKGDAGEVKITATKGITLNGERSDGSPSGIASQVFPGAVGRSGGILIDTSTLSLTNGGQISTATFGEGDVGLVQITATEGITIDGETSDGFPSGILSQVEFDAVGKIEGILIDTSTLSLTNGGEIDASTFGAGDAGLVQITATEGITLDGEKIVMVFLVPFSVKYFLVQWVRVREYSSIPLPFLLPMGEK